MVDTVSQDKKAPRVPSPNFLIRGSDYYAESAPPGFKLTGRDEDLDKIYSILMLPTSNNVMLTGLRGVGVSSMIYGLQAAKTDPRTPFDMVHKHYYVLETDRLFSLDSKEEIEKGFKAALATLDKDPQSVLVVPDMGDFIEAATNCGCKHFFNMMMHDLDDKSGNQALFLCREDKLNTVYNAHSDMHKLFTLHEMLEPKGNVLKEIVASQAGLLAKSQGIAIDPSAIDTAMDMATRPCKDPSMDLAQPGRTIKLLERAMVSYRIDAHRNPQEIVKLEAELKEVNTALTTGKFSKALIGRSQSELETIKIETETKIAETKTVWDATQQKVVKLNKEQRKAEDAITKRETDIEGRRAFLKKQEDSENARLKRMSENGTLSEEQQSALNASADFKDDIENSGYDMDSEIKQLKEELEKAREIADEKRGEYRAIADEINSKLSLTAEHVLAEFSRLSGIPVNKLNQDESEKLLTMEDTLNARVFGQEPATRGLSDAVMIARSGLKEPNKPDGVFFFLGPSGTGKTESAKALTEILFDDPSCLIRINMSEYQEKNAIAKLIGAPPGYEGFEVGGALTNAVRKKPFSVVLFDEVEKGHPDIMDILLQVLDDGELGDNIGRKVSFKNTVVIVTSNIGAEFFLDPSLSYEEAKEKALAELETRFRPEFLNRFNGRENIITFNRLELPQMIRIANRELGNLTKKVAPKGLSVVMDPEAIEQICTDFYEPKAGARRIPALFNSRIYPDIAKTIIRSPDARGAMKINYDTTTKKFVVNPPRIVVANENDMAREIAAVAVAQGFNAATTGPR